MTVNITGTFQGLSQTAQRIINNTIRLEGKYGNNPYDRGGATCWGITTATARRYGYTGDMSLLPLSFAKDIYAYEFWTGNSCEDILVFSELITEFHFDIGVNGGTGRPWYIEAEILNALNDGSWPVLPVQTKKSTTVLDALKTATEKLGEKQMFNYLNWTMGTWYMNFTERDPTQRVFFNGWISARIRFV